MRRARFYVEVKVSHDAPWVRKVSYGYLQPAFMQASACAAMVTNEGVKVFIDGVRIRYRGLTLAKWKGGCW